MAFVYLLTPKSNEWQGKKTYIGFTTNPKRRLRQHNREIKGGAKRTARYYPWKFVCVIGGFTSKRKALQFEWMYQKPTKSLKSRHLIRGRRGLGKLGTVDRKLNELRLILPLFPHLTVHYS
jgi:structure-specific endonuclease subunit SLX1